MMSSTPLSKQMLRQLPAIDALLQQPDVALLIAEYGRPILVDALRITLARARQSVLNNHPVDMSPSGLIEAARTFLVQQFQPTLRPVINATGVIIHTNLGRALLSKAAQQAVMDVASQYNTLEFNLSTGKRGSRYLHAEQALCEITGAEAALVVNNNAAALILILSALARDKSVILSRGQLVEIGGGFRIPDIMQQSGADLVEVGTTNRTRIADYQTAITEETALLMRIHSSNFKQIGFVEETPLSEMVNLAHKHNLRLVDDLGSGALIETVQYGLALEPTVQASVEADADIIAFSGDKLLGGPQAGIIVGKAELIQRLKKHPLARAIRADKLCYAALSATLDHYRKHQAIEHIPVWQMIARSTEDILSTVEAWHNQIGGQIIEGESAVGGGSLPGTTLPTYLLALEVPSAERAANHLRQADLPITARIQEEQLLFDPRTVLPQQEKSLIATLRQL